VQKTDIFSPIYKYDLLRRRQVIFNMLIRRATIEDVPLLTTIIRNSFRDVAERFNLTPENSPTHPSNCTEEWINRELDKGITYYILENNGKPCGCVALELARPKVCYLERLAVLPQFRRKGFGGALVRHVLEEAHKKEALRVEIGIIAKHTELREWYEKLGFSVKETVHFNHLPFDVTFMLIQL
jgi:N-acetylglutamate synthase-like GNAT family acetyltransferase